MEKKKKKTLIFGVIRVRSLLVAEMISFGALG